MKQRPASADAASSDPAMPARRLSRSAALMRPSLLRDLLASGEPPRLSLAGGLPPAEAFPFDAVATVTAQMFADHDVRALQYTPAEGDPQLRQQIVDLLAPRHQRTVIPEQVIITTGSQQGIDLVGRVLLDPGDVAVVESPTYVGALRALAPTEARIVGVRCDDGGIDTEELERRLRQGLRPTLCYLVANFSNPSGATLTAERRRHIALLAEHYGFVVVEDDQYGRLRFRGDDIDPIAAETDSVVYLSGFSKIIAPGLRAGFSVAPEWLVRPLVLAKQATDLAASSIGQRVASRLLETPGWLDSHLDALRHLYAERADTLLDAVEQRLEGKIRARRPDGGMFTWATLLDDAVAAAELVAECRRRGLAVMPGNEFSVDGGFDHALRLSYSSLSPDELVEAVDVMGVALDAVARSGG